jgi:hypothetical protein
MENNMRGDTEPFLVRCAEGSLGLKGSKPQLMADPTSPLYTYDNSQSGYRQEEWEITSPEKESNRCEVADGDETA